MELDMREHPKDGLPVDDDRYNTHHHPQADIIAALGAHAGDFTHADPPRHLYAYAAFASAITASQKIHASKCNTLTLPTFSLHELDVQFMRLYNNRKVGVDEILDDMTSAIKSCCGVIFDSTVVPQRYFVRLPDASPKDSPHWGLVTTLKELLALLCTSMRARNQITDQLALSQGLTVFLRPWDDGIVEGVEFRVFVPPPLTNDRGFKVSAISQYVWHKPLSVQDSERVKEIAEIAAKDAPTLLDVIVTAAVAGDTIDGFTASRLHYGHRDQDGLEGSAAGRDQSLWCYEPLWKLSVSLDFRRE